MNVALISLGSNNNREHNIALCNRLLDDIYPDILYSATSVTKPYGERYQHDFLNQLAVIRTDRPYEEVIDTLKSLEKRIGRTPEDKLLGLVRIDIDLIVWNNKILKPEDMHRSYIHDLLPTLPHPEMFKF
ncbi:hypothetical protein D0T66_01915 [Dysgonomonas sp. 25]|nr:hypothetical protein [Dysgonomonas sp. 25]